MPALEASQAMHSSVVDIGANGLPVVRVRNAENHKPDNLESLLKLEQEALLIEDIERARSVV